MNVLMWMLLACGSPSPCPRGEIATVPAAMHVLRPPVDADGVYCEAGPDEVVTAYRGETTASILRRYTRHYGAHGWTVSTVPGGLDLSLDGRPAQVRVTDDAFGARSVARWSGEATGRPAVRLPPVTP